jgi:hypothetical protein
MSFMDYVVLGLVLFGLVAMVVGTLRARRTKRDQRARYLSDYPSLESLLATIDKDKYREIRDNNGRTGIVHATRAVMRDFPGITLQEAADVAKSLGT